MKDYSTPRAERQLCVAAAILICGAMVACRGSTTFTGSTPGSGILMTTSFEIVGMPSLKGWTSNSGDTAVAGFSVDVPPGGGSYSVRLRNEWSFGGTVRTAFAAPSGTYPYKLSSWTRSSPQGLLSEGFMDVMVKRQDTMFVHRRLNFADTVWTLQTLVDTIGTNLNDSIIISLSGSFGQFSGGWTFIDLCTFERLD